MYCPHCLRTNPADAPECQRCQQDTSYFRERLHIGRQFIFVRADERHPVALKIDDEVQAFQAPVILSRHKHAFSFGDDVQPEKPASLRRRLFSRRQERSETSLRPLPDQPRLPSPSLTLLTIVSDRKIYRPGDEVTLFIVAPDAAEQEATLEVQLAGNKVYETEMTLNQQGLALHTYDDLEEGEFTAVVTLPDDTHANCEFSVAEFTLSPLIAILKEHSYEQKRLSFTLKLLLLSHAYTGSAEVGLQCKICGDRVVATQEVKVTNGTVEAEFDVSGHGGPFHVQVTTPDGNTALVAFPGTGAVEREHIKANTLGQTADIGLLPWQDAQLVRGFYIGSGEMNMTPLMLKQVVADSGQLEVASDIAQAQIVTFNPRAGQSQVYEYGNLQRGQPVEFQTAAPYTLFTVAALLSREEKEAFEGWGIIIKPSALEATLTTPETARPGEEIDIYVEIPAVVTDAEPTPAFCWLLVYDARLEHESPVPRLAKRIYESTRDASGSLHTGPVVDAQDLRWSPPEDFVLGAGRGFFQRRMAMPPTPARSMMLSDSMPAVTMAATPFAAQPADMEMVVAGGTTAVETPVMVMAPTRMEFPEIAYQELFHFAGQAARTVRLGDQIGTWRVRAYVFSGIDYQELTADVQADKPLYAELDLPAIASEGDEISAAVNYFSREPAELLVATPFGETRIEITGSGMERFPIRGPGRVEVHLHAGDQSDMSVRHVARPGVQTVTASRLRILEKGETVAGERVVAYASMGQVLKETITALTDYPFG